MNIKSYLAAAALCALAPLTHAGVVYQWQALNDKAPWDLELMLEFDRRTVKSGSFTFSHDQAFDTSPKHGLLNVRYSYRGNEHGDYFYSAKNGGFRYRRGNIHMSLNFDNEGFLTGSISANDELFHGFEMESVARIFTVTNVGAELTGMESAGCIPGEICGGAMGYIRRVGEVPEPASIALLALGVAGLASTRRRKIGK